MKSRTILTAWLCALSLIALTFGPASADPNLLIITTFDDDSDTNGNCTLREALQAVHLDQPVDACPAGSSIDGIRLTTGYYTLTLGDLDIYTTVHIDGRDSTLDANRLDRAFEIHGDGTHAMIDSLAIIGGYVGDNTGGGGIFIHSGASLSLWNVSVSFNEVSGAASGGGIINDGRLFVEDTIIEGNAIFEAGPGAGIANYGYMSLVNVAIIHNGIDIEGEGGGIGNYGEAEISGSRIAYNSGSEDGGGIYSNQGVLTITDTIIENNHISFGTGGGLNVSGKTRLDHVTIRNNAAGEAGGGIQNGGDLEILDSLIENNSDNDEGTDGGGGIYSDGGTLTIERTTFRGNRSDPSTGEAGALHLTGPGRAYLTDVVFAENGILLGEADPRYNTSEIFPTLSLNRAVITGSEWGAITQYFGSLLLANTTLSGNSKTTGGAGLFVFNGTAELNSVTITNNISETGASGMFAQDGNITLHNSLLAANDTPSPDCAAPPGTIHSLGYNLVGSSDGCSWQKASGDRIGTTAQPINPRLFLLADNGGDTLTHALRSNSLAVDSGDPLSCLPVDQRRAPRPQDGNGNGTALCDIGAYEAPANPNAEPGVEVFIYLPVIAR